MGETSVSPTGDVIAIFHCSFHPTKGNNIDWSRKIDDAINLDGVEFNALPSGLHDLEDDVIHFTKDSFHGICLFQRRETQQQGMRGYHLNSVGILVAQSPRPQPWKHISSLKETVRLIVGSGADPFWIGESNPLDDYFERNKSSTLQLEDDAESNRWEDEYASNIILNRPVEDISHLVHAFGPFFFTLYKHVLGGRRILIYCQPPVEPACILAQVMADICLAPRHPFPPPTLTLGMISLNDIDRLKSAAMRKEAWIAVTTDRVFFDKADLYDMIIDLTDKGRREKPVLWVSNRERRWYEPKLAARKLHRARFTWSDIALWIDFEKGANVPLEKDEPPDSNPENLSRWRDISDVYNFICLVIGKFCLPSSRPSDSITLRNHPTFQDLVLNPFQWRTSFLLSTLDQITSEVQSPEASTITLPPAVLTNFDLGPLSASDARFLEWLGERNGRKLEVRRSWKDLLCVAFGIH